MKRKFPEITYLSVLKYLIISVVFFVINKLTPKGGIYGISMLCALLVNGTSLFITPLIYLLTSLLSVPTLILYILISTLVLTIIFFIYKLTNFTPRFEIIIFTFMSLIPYLLFYNNEVYVKIIESGATAILSGVFTLAIKTLYKKGLKYKLQFEEISSLILLAVCFGLGVSNNFGVGVWKTVIIFCLLFSTYLFRLGISSLVSAILALPLTVYFNDFSFVGAFVIISAVAIAFNDVSRYISAISVILTEFILQAVFKLFPEYTYFDIIFTSAGAFIFSVIPTKYLTLLKERLYSFRERQLVRQSINRNRLMLSNRLYEISEVFLEIGNAFCQSKRKTVSESKISDRIKENLKENVCSSCSNYAKCKASKTPKNESVEKLIQIGLAKGKISFIDVPTDISDKCIKANNFIYAINKELADYRAYVIDSMNRDKSKMLIGKGAMGVAQILKGLALESSQTLKYKSRLERKISDSLFKKGIPVFELLIYGEMDNLTISMILTIKEIPLSVLEKTISETVGVDMYLAEKSNLTEDKINFIFKNSPKYDAVFGLAFTTKDGSTKSGDTHSVTRLSGDKFMVALSDGMGSGKYAENLSDTSLSLIESFYKAGMNTPLILDTVNQVLAINSEDTFTALDLSVINLKTLQADFIKFGAPYGFIISQEGIKVVESNSLPLGILNELKPCVHTTFLAEGDVLLFVTDGIFDAFKSTSNFIDYIRKEPAFNPQTLCDSVLNKALELLNGQRKDDMTCLAVRLFERTS